MSILLDNIDKIKARIDKSCRLVGRSVEEVNLLAVSKTKPPAMIEEAVSAGLRLFGENKVQEAQNKIPLCPEGIDWHLIGHLQSNKAKIAAQMFHMIHSVDSLKVLKLLDANAENTLPILLQVNVAGEAAKFGLAPQEVASVIEECNTLKYCEVHGLMTIPPFSEDAERTRMHFRALRELRDQLQDTTNTPLPELSMGMSHDLEIAIEEGSTWVRIGSDLFGARS